MVTKIIQKLLNSHKSPYKNTQHLPATTIMLGLAADSVTQTFYILYVRFHKASGIELKHGIFVSVE